MASSPKLIQQKQTSKHTTVSSNLLGTLDDRRSPLRDMLSRLSVADDPFLALKNGEYVVLETVRTAGGGCHCDKVRDGPFASASPSGNSL